MRFVFVGASEKAVRAAHLLCADRHQVVLIDIDRARLDELSATLDCAFLCGDGSRPHVLAEASMRDTDVLFAVTDDDRANLLASLVGRSLGAKRVVTGIHDPEYESICVELGLTDTIVPSRTIGRYLADMALGQDILELSSALRAEGRLFTFIVTACDAVPITKLCLPQNTRVMCYYRADAFLLPDGTTEFHVGDEVVLVTHGSNLPVLHQRWTALVRSPV